MAVSDPASRPVVLVVEDEPMLRMYATDFVGEAGFEVIEAANADEAIRILLGRDDVRVVFTDIDMPGSMDGLRLAAAVRDRWPPIEIIVTSGQVTPPRDALPARGLFFSKPYDEARLIRALQAFVR